MAAEALQMEVLLERQNLPRFQIQLRRPLFGASGFARRVRNVLIARLVTRVSYWGAESGTLWYESWYLDSTNTDHYREVAQQGRNTRDAAFLGSQLGIPDRSIYHFTFLNTELLKYRDEQPSTARTHLTDEGTNQCRA